MQELRRLKRNLLLWMIFPVSLMILIIIVGIYLQNRGLNTDWLMPFNFFMIVSYPLIVSYYGLKKKVTLEPDILIVILVISFGIIGASLFGMLGGALGGALGGFIGFLSNKAKFKTKEGQERLAKIVGIISLFISLLLLIGYISLEMYVKNKFG